MPNLSARLGGFGSGKSASNALVYLTVIEEWASGSVGVSALVRNTGANSVNLIDIRVPNEPCNDSAHI